MQKIIDIHSHLFNLKYLPVAGIIYRYGNGYIPKWVANGLEYLLIKNTRESFLSSEFNVESLAGNQLSARAYLLSNVPKISFEAVAGFNDNQLLETIIDLASVEDLISGPLSDALVEFNDTLTPEVGFIKLTHFYSEAEIIGYRRGLLRRLLNMVMSKILGFGDYLKWFLFMTRSEEDLYEYLDKIDSINVHQFVHSMMDVDHYFNDPVGDTEFKSYFSYETQISNMVKLNAKFPKLISFVAFSPARPNSFDIVKDAIENKGFKGVKFYPPMGYNADVNDIYFDKINELLEYCCDKEIPLFAHCTNEGFQAGPYTHTGHSSNPKFWERALKRLPKGKKSLRLCLAHGGGTAGWFAENLSEDKIKADLILAKDIKDDENVNWNSSYAAMVFKLCVKYPNVYCDASYLDEMILRDGYFEPEFRTRFKKRLIALFESEPRFAEKIIYGSDWHMLFQESKNNVYLKKYIEFFGDSEFDEYRDLFFYKNAERYLKIDTVAPNIIVSVK